MVYLSSSGRFLQAKNTVLFVKAFYLKVPLSDMDLNSFKMRLDEKTNFLGQAAENELCTIFTMELY